MDASSALRAVKGGVELDVMVTPNAKSSGIGEVDPWRKRLVVKVPERALEGRANKAVEDVLSEKLGVRAQIIRGQLDRHKTVFAPIGLKEALERLEP